MSKNSLQLDSLTAGYTAHGVNSIITADFSTTVNAGTFVCVLGINGAGKSTLLRTIAGLQQPLGGHVIHNGTDIGKFSPRMLARTMGAVLTDRQVFATHITTSELVSMGRMPYTGLLGTLSDNDRNIVNEAMQTLGISDLAHRRVGTLSDGERQKTMIAKTLAQQTPVILLDEPTAFLDFPSETGAFRFLRRLAHEEKKLVIAVTHTLAAALQTADILWLLARGETPVVGTPHDLARNGRLSMFFDDTGVIFDTETLSYYIESDDKNDSMYR